MKTFKEFITEKELNERFINLIGAEEEKRKYAQDVWNILQYAYREIGGIKGSGFNNIEDMIKNIPFWKLIMHNGVMHGVAMYKDRNGRKLVASGVKQGSEYGRLKVIDIAKNDLKRSYGEKSKGALGALMKSVPWDVLESFMLTPKKSEKVIPIDEVPWDEIPQDGKQTLERFPHLKPYAYLRVIGDELVFKVSMGTPGNTIT